MNKKEKGVVHMGTWGTKLNQNDVAEDVKESYINKQRAGKTLGEALQELLEEDRAIFEDADDKYHAWYALAEIMWKYGHLTEDVKRTVLQLIEEEPVEKIWTNKKEAQNRRKVLDELQNKMLSEMPPYKKISVHKPFITEWKPEEIYLYQIKNPPNDPADMEESNQYIGWWIIIYVKNLISKEFVVKGIKDTYPIVYIKMSADKPKNIEDINNAEFIVDSYDCSIGDGQYAFVIDGPVSKKVSKQSEFFGISEEFAFPESAFPSSAFPQSENVQVDEYITDFSMYNTFPMYVIRYYKNELERKEYVKRMNFASWKSIEQRKRIYEDNKSILSKAKKWSGFISLGRRLENEEEIKEKHMFVTSWLPHDTYLYRLNQAEIEEDIYMVIYVDSLRTAVVDNEKLYLPDLFIRLIRGEKEFVPRRLINYLPDVCFGISKDGTPLYKATLLDKVYDEKIEYVGKCEFYLAPDKYGQEQKLNEKDIEKQESEIILMTWEDIVNKAVELYKNL
ncbi:MAG: hypothetical protein IJA27_00890 [Lachnospiraceae bacterium]|nr:hypothetical protein [Lachnospiraceae bacterium]